MPSQREVGPVGEGSPAVDCRSLTLEFRISDQIISTLASVSTASLYIYEVERRHIMAAVIWGTVLRFMYVAAFGLEC